MDGPSHYREAERLLKVNSDNPNVRDGMDRVLLAAQVPLLMVPRSGACGVDHAQQQILLVAL